MSLVSIGKKGFAFKKKKRDLFTDKAASVVVIDIIQ